MEDAPSFLIQVRDLSIWFGGLQALSEVDFQVYDGQIYSLIGPNGAGKTTVLNLINGIYLPTSGDIIFAGESIVGFSPHVVTQRGIARTFQNIRVFGGLNVLENTMVARHVRSSVNFLSTIFKTPSARQEEREIYAKAEDVLKFVGLADKMKMDATN